MGHSVARYVRLLAPLTPLTRSAVLRFDTLASLCSLRYARFATLASLARSIHGLAHSLRSLTRGTVKIHEYVFILKMRFTITNAFFIVSRNTPSI